MNFNFEFDITQYKKYLIGFAVVYVIVLLYAYYITYKIIKNLREGRIRLSGISFLFVADCFPGVTSIVSYLMCNFHDQKFMCTSVIDEITTGMMTKEGRMMLMTKCPIPINTVL